MNELSAFGLPSFVLAALTALLGLLGGWLGAYLKVKAEHLATREDYDAVLGQLRASTHAVEEIREELNDRARRVQHTAQHIESQIEEFYGPLFNLVHQLVIANHVQHQILTDPSAAARLTDEQRSVIAASLRERHFLPVHREINDILKRKLYLVNGAVLPSAFYRYLRHAIQEQVQAELWREKGIDTSYVSGAPYPNELYDVVKAGLDLLMQRYEALMGVGDGQAASGAPPWPRTAEGSDEQH